jgi:murein DD-endopeptidase MepM/ murein hydrolase activator NlpD
MRLRLLLLAFAIPLLLWGALPLVSSADEQDKVARLQRKIDDAQGKLSHVNGKAKVLTSDITSLTRRIDTLQGGITTLQRRQNAIQSDLNVRRGALERTQRELRTVRAQLARLRATLAHARTVLAERIVAAYKNDRPDLVTVVLRADGFADLLESSAYLRRVGRQDRQVITTVRTAKAAALTATKRLGTLEGRQRSIAAEISRQRDAVARLRITLVGKRDEIDRMRGVKRRALGTVRASAADLHERVDYLESQQSKVERQIRAASQRSSGASLPAGPIRGGGTFVWPVNGPITSPFCESRAWERCHPGVDIGVPSGTPIRAAGTGKVILAGPVSGYGNYTCVQHSGPLSTCYAHQSQIRVSVGQSVSQGQVIGISGCTGLCFGAHLHFEVRVNGSVVNPLNYLG